LRCRESTRVLSGHQAATLDWMAPLSRILCVGDTTFLNYPGQRATTGLGPHSSDCEHGFLLHPLVALIRAVRNRKTTAGAKLWAEAASWPLMHAGRQTLAVAARPAPPRLNCASAKWNWPHQSEPIASCQPCTYRWFGCANQPRRSERSPGVDAVDQPAGSRTRRRPGKSSGVTGNTGRSNDFSMCSNKAAGWRPCSCKPALDWRRPWPST
jgi:hypothetical protein